MTAGPPVSELTERPHWILRGLVVLGIVVVVILGRQFMRSTSLRMTDAPQRVALTDPEPQPAARAPEPETKPPEQSAQELPEEIVDVGPTVIDSGPSAMDDQLGVDADAAAGFDSFGLRAKRGGRDLTLDLGKPERLAGKTGTAEEVYAAYAARLAGELKAWLSKEDALRRVDYQIRARIWIDGVGAVTRCRFLDSTGDAALDRRLEERVVGVYVGNEPPEGLPQPINLIIRSRGAGKL